MQKTTDFFDRTSLEKIITPERWEKLVFDGTSIEEDNSPEACFSGLYIDNEDNLSACLVDLYDFATLKEEYFKGDAAALPWLNKAMHYVCDHQDACAKALLVGSEIPLKSGMNFSSSRVLEEDSLSLFGVFYNITVELPWFASRDTIITCVQDASKELDALRGAVGRRLKDLVLYVKKAEERNNA